ncbi:MAG: hypothetical protein WAM70_00895, partial [Pyrinomonadaceae bacterium]
MNPTFPTLDYSAGLDRFERQNSSRRIAESSARVCGLSHDADRLKRRASKLVQEARAFIHLNPELALAPSRQIAAYILMWIAPVAVCFVDYILLGAVLEYFARRIYSDPAMVTVARTIIPAAIVTIEMMIASQRSFLREQTLRPGHSPSRWTWDVFPLLMLIPLPAMVVATHYASVPATRTPTFETILKLQLIGLVALSVVMHGVVLYGGQLAFEAKAYFFFKLRISSINRKLKRWQSQFETRITEFSNAYVEHV